MADRIYYLLFYVNFINLLHVLADGVYLNKLLDEFNAYARMLKLVKN